MMSHFYKMCTVSQLSLLFAHTLILITFSTAAHCKLLKCENTTEHIGVIVILLNLSMGGAKFESRLRPAILTAFSWSSLVPPGKFQDGTTATSKYFWTHCSQIDLPFSASLRY